MTNNVIRFPFAPAIDAAVLTPLCKHLADTRCIWCILPDKPPTPQEIADCMRGEFSDEIVDRCCSECGDHFDGSPDDDYCGNCWDKLYPELNFIEDEE